MTGGPEPPGAADKELNADFAVRELDFLVRSVVFRSPLAALPLPPLTEADYALLTTASHGAGAGAGGAGTSQQHQLHEQSSQRQVPPSSAADSPAVAGLAPPADSSLPAAVGLSLSPAADAALRQQLAVVMFTRHGRTAMYGSFDDTLQVPSAKSANIQRVLTPFYEGS